MREFAQTQKPAPRAGFAHPARSKRIRIQPKLTIGAPGDAYEQEADRTADQVMRMPEPGVQRKCACGGGCPECAGAQDQGDAHEHLQRTPLQMKSVSASSDTGIEAPPIVHDVLNSPGQPLDSATRAFMEPRFGRDFSQVRVHADARAADAASAINARAFTMKREIVFGTGEYTPRNELGQQLISHELTHVVQQQTSTSHLLQKQPQPRNQMAGILSPFHDPGFQKMFQKMAEEWFLLDSLKHPIVKEIAEAYTSRPGKIELADRVIKDTPYGGDKVIPGYHEPGYQEVYNAIYGVFKIRKIGKGNKVTDWDLGEVPTRQKTLGEQTKEARKFVYEEYGETVKEELTEEALKKATAKVSTRWLAGRALVVVLKFVLKFAPVVGEAMLVLDVLDLYKSLGGPAELSAANQKRANIIAGVKDWLQGKKEAAERKKSLGAPLQVPIYPAVRDETIVRKF